MASVKVQEIIVSTSFIYFVPAMFLPVLWWMYSTRDDNWNFYDRKKLTLKMVVLNDCMVLSQIIWRFLFDTAVVWICQIPVSRNMDSTMLLNACRLVLCGSSVGLTVLIFKAYNHIMEDQNITSAIEGFRWQHIVDTRKNKNRLYDLSIMKNMKSGDMVKIKENDRFVHMFVLGNSGTGKTSSTITPSVICDLDNKIRNMMLRTRKIERMIKENKAYVDKPKMMGEINEWCVKAKKGHEEELNDIRKHYPDCGMTIMAPNNSLNDDIIRLAKARSLTVNVIDPAFTYKEKNVRMLGINPFFVELGLDFETRQIQIANKAQTFAEVLMAVSEINGTGDQYFRDINTSVTTNIAIMTMLRANLHGYQTNIAEVQACINDFGKLKPIVDDIQKELHMTVTVATPKTNKNKKNNDGRITKPEEDEEAPKFPGEDCVIEDGYTFRLITSEEEIQEPYRSMGYTVEQYNDMFQMQAAQYYEPIHFVMQELLGEGQEKMFDQARGLRNLINKLLLDPRIKKILSASEKDFIDWDRALAENEITVINTALEFGPQGSTALGLFIMLNMKTSIMRRPKNTRTNHFLYIDEASQYMHPMFEDMFALYRQYKVACTIALQSLSQMQKTPTTKYLEGVIMGAGIHIVFGRVNANEMKYYEAMAGMQNKEETVVSTSKNSEFDENHSISMSSRTSVKQSNMLDGYQIRQRDFQEVTVYMIDNGRVKNGFIAKMSFSKKTDYEDKKIQQIDFTRYAKFDTRETKVNMPAPDGNNRAKEQLEKHAVGIKHTDYRNENEVFKTLPDINIENESFVDKNHNMPNLGQSNRDAMVQYTNELEKQTMDMNRNAQNGMTNKENDTDPLRNALNESFGGYSNTENKTVEENESVDIIDEEEAEDEFMEQQLRLLNSDRRAM